MVSGLRGPLGVFPRSAGTLFGVFLKYCPEVWSLAWRKELASWSLVPLASSAARGVACSLLRLPRRRSPMCGERIDFGSPCASRYGPVGEPCVPVWRFWRPLASWGFVDGPWRLLASAWPHGVLFAHPSKSSSPGGSLVMWRATCPTVSVVGGLGFGEPTPIAPVFNERGLR